MSWGLIGEMASLGAGTTSNGIYYHYFSYILHSNGVNWKWSFTSL